MRKRMPFDSGDFVIEGGLVYDGSGGEPRKARVAVRNGIIRDISPHIGLCGARVIDAANLAVAPGFIDIHSHSDENLLIDPKASSKVYQGVTTEVIGNCGSSPAPLKGQYGEEYSRDLKQRFDMEPSWTTCAGFFELLEKKGLGVNCLMLVGNGALRGGVLGYDSRAAHKGAQEEMRRELDLAMEEGAWGLSSGLIYVPSSFSDTAELTGLASVVAGRKGIYATHMRGEGDSLLPAVQEALNTAEQSGVTLQISHLKASGERNWHKLDRVIGMIGDARNSGTNVCCDVYPYTASSTTIDSMFPAWIREGGHQALRENLGDGEKRARLGREMTAAKWDRIVISSIQGARDRSLYGKTLQELGVIRCRPPLEALVDLLREETGDMTIIHFSQSEENVRKVIRMPFSFFGSDAAARAPEGLLALDMPHPRAYGTFPRILGHYARDERLISLTEAVSKMTFLPARHLGLRGRGLLRRGCYADIVVFDPLSVADNSSYADPHRFPAGIRHVMINGIPVIEGGVHTGALPGKVLRLEN